jgi:polygalacturonase
MSGGVFDVHASNVTCISAGQVLNVKSCLGRGGVVSNITLADSARCDARYHPGG